MMHLYRTHGKPYVAPIHQNQEHAPYSREVGVITSANKGNSNDVVGHHLNMVLSLRFGIENQYLMNIECCLKQVIEFDGGRNWNVRIICPKRRAVVYGGRKIKVEVLNLIIS